MKIQSIIDHLESLAHPEYQEDYDNSGLIIGDPGKEVKKGLICIDCTEEVVNEAIRRKCGLIISHHPILFSPVYKLVGATYVERVIIKAIEHQISIYAIHTNLDNVIKGVNSMICKKLGLEKTKILVPDSRHGKNVGAGMIGVMHSYHEEVQFMKHIKSKLKVEMIRHTPFTGKRIKRVAVCGGSGSFLLKYAIEQKADVFVTADFKYHQFFDAEGKILIADIGHYESEQHTKELLHDFLKKKFRNFAPHISKLNTNPVNYF